MENLAIAPHTRSASAFCERLMKKTSGEPSSMSNNRPKRETMCFEEATVSNICEIASDGGRVGEDRKASQEGVLSLVA